VLDRPCPECGFDAGALPPAAIPAHLEDAAERWRAVLARPGTATRPAPAVAERYGEQDPIVVSEELAAACEEALAAFSDVAEPDWTRPRTRSNGARVTFATLGQYLVHDVVHHLGDVEG
jgi:hypothetical protein